MASREGARSAPAASAAASAADSDSDSPDEGDFEYQPEEAGPSRMVTNLRRRVAEAEADCAPNIALAAKWQLKLESRLDYELGQAIAPLEAMYLEKVHPKVLQAQAKLEEKREERRKARAEKAEAERKEAAVEELEALRAAEYRFYIQTGFEDTDPLHAAATKINTGVRGVLARAQFKEIVRRAEQDEMLRAVRTCQRCVRRVIYMNATRPHRMATALQAQWRGYRTRQWWKTWAPQQLAQRKNDAAALIQSAYRGLLRRRQFAFTLFTAKQEALSQGLISRRVRKKRTLDTLPRWKKDTEAATRIQRMMRAKKNRGSMMKGLRRQMRRDAAKAKTAAVFEAEEAELLKAEQGYEVTELQAAEKGWVNVMRSHLEVAASNDRDLTEMMLERDRSGRTPLHVACINGHLKVVEELVGEWTHAIDMAQLVCAEDNGGRTPLHLAASQSKVKCAKLIIATGHAPLKVAAHDGRTALHAAAVASCQPMAQLLYEHKPWLLKQRDRSGKEALDLARELDPDSSLCSFLEHCYKFGATWKVIEWVDPTPLDGILDV